MTDDERELRALIRTTVARRLATRNPGSAPAVSSVSARSSVDSSGAHPSHQLYLALVNPQSACLIEPHVPCNHCGYCKTHGY